MSTLHTLWSGDPLPTEDEDMLRMSGESTMDSYWARVMVLVKNTSEDCEDLLKVDPMGVIARHEVLLEKFIKATLRPVKPVSDSSGSEYKGHLLVLFDEIATAILIWTRHMGYHACKVVNDYSWTKDVELQPEKIRELSLVDILTVVCIDIDSSFYYHLCHWMSTKIAGMGFIPVEWIPAFVDAAVLRCHMAFA